MSTYDAVICQCGQEMKAKCRRFSRSVAVFWMRCPGCGLESRSTSKSRAMAYRLARNPFYDL